MRDRRRRCRPRRFASSSRRRCRSRCRCSASTSCARSASASKWTATSLRSTCTKAATCSSRRRPATRRCENHALQTSLGADIRLMDRDALRAKFPWLNVDDLVSGAYGASGEGWFDGYGRAGAAQEGAGARCALCAVRREGRGARRPQGDARGHGRRRTLCVRHARERGRRVDAHAVVDDGHRHPRVCAAPQHLQRVVAGEAHGLPAADRSDRRVFPAGRAHVYLRDVAGWTATRTTCRSTKSTTTCSTK